MPLTLDGPRLKPASRAEQLVVLLHGYGAGGHDLIAIGSQWRSILPGAAFVAPNAPEPCPDAPGGRQWFRLTLREEAERWRGVNKAHPVLDAFLDAELARHGLNDSKLALVGFSQGAMLALHTGLRRAKPLAAVIGYSGLLVLPDGENDLSSPAATSIAPPILLVHGSEDDLIPAGALLLSAEKLAQAGIPCQWHLSIGVGHAIDGEGLMHGGLFLAKCFGLRPNLLKARA
ncbi:MAG: dienelactone hydrolase family protein [Methylocapsa sp.]|nr:dienelactone hydrolase family protein [Methylocapsa sp.]